MTDPNDTPHQMGANVARLTDAFDAMADQLGVGPNSERHGRTIADMMATAVEAASDPAHPLHLPPEG